MTRTQRVPFGSLLKGDPLGKKGSAPKPAAKDKPAKAKKGARK